jgi:hypothetical protein
MFKQSSSKALKSSSLIIGKSGRTMGSSVTVELLPVVFDARRDTVNVILLSINYPSSIMSLRTLYECSQHICHI